MYKIAKLKMLTQVVNNIKIRTRPTDGRTQCIAPNGRILEIFKHAEDAVRWAQKQQDFLISKN